MPLTVYFTQPDETFIAGRDPAFINMLEQAANTAAGIGVADKAESADVVLVDEHYDFKTWLYTEKLTNCDFVRQHASRICVMNHDDHARVFLPGLYTSLEQSKPSLVHALPIPYKRDLWKTAIPNTNEIRPSRLFVFRGTYHSHPVRKKMAQALSGLEQGDCEEFSKTFHSHNEFDQSQYLDDILDAQFSLCPRGFSPSTYRLYESMQLGRCPVVISDDWVPPFGPDWDRFSIFVAQKSIRDLPEILMSHLDDADARGKLASDAWLKHFSWPGRWTYFLEQVIRHNETNTKGLSFAELKDIWNGRPFRQQYEWTTTSRIKRFLSQKTQTFAS